MFLRILFILILILILTLMLIIIVIIASIFHCQLLGQVYFHYFHFAILNQFSVHV